MKRYLIFFLVFLAFELSAKPNRKLIYQPKVQQPNYGGTSEPQLTQQIVFANPPPSLNNATNPVTRTVLPNDETAPARFRFAPVMGIQNTALGYGGMGEISFSTGAPFFIGVQSGYLQFGSDPTAENVHLTLIPILATFTYRFNLSRGSVHPYLGVGIGASLMNGTINEDGTTNVIGSTHADFMAMGRPGIEFELSHVTSFFLEPQLGVMQTHFVFMPQAGFAFNF